MKKLSRRNYAFTLLEILVVLAIIAILASVLLAVFLRVREQGRQTTCRSNLHQIGLAIQQYISDNNGFYPPIQSSSPTRWVNWSELLQPYLKSTQVFDCPSHTERYPAGQLGEGAAPDFAGDYDYNWFNIRNRPHQPYNEDKSENLLDPPQETAVVFDAGWIDSVDRSKHYLQPTIKDDLGGQVYHYGVHDGGANFLFADGHVKWLSADQQTKLPNVGGWADPPQDKA